MQDLTTGVLPALLWLALSAAAPAAEKGVDFRTDAFVGQQDGYHTYRIPAMVITAKGTVLLFCEVRKSSRKDSGDIDQLMKRSEDGGRTWSKQVLIHEEGGNTPIRAGNPCCIVERDGKTALATCSPNGLEMKGALQVSGEGPSWAHPVVAGGRLYLRYDDNLYCFDVAGGGDPASTASGNADREHRLFIVSQFLR